MGDGEREPGLSPRGPVCAGARGFLQLSRFVAPSSSAAASSSSLVSRSGGRNPPSRPAATAACAWGTEASPEPGEGRGAPGAGAVAAVRGCQCGGWGRCFPRISGKSFVR